MRRFALVVGASVVLCSCALARAQAQPRGTGRPQSTPWSRKTPISTGVKLFQDLAMELTLAP